MSSDDTLTAEVSAELLPSEFASLTLSASTANTPAVTSRSSYSATPPGSSHGSGTLHSNHDTTQSWYSPSPAGDCLSCGSPLPPPTTGSLFPGVPIQDFLGCGDALSCPNCKSAQTSIPDPERVNNPHRMHLSTQDRRRRNAVDLHRVSRGGSRVSKNYRRDPKGKSTKCRSSPRQAAGNDQNEGRISYNRRHRGRSNVVEALNRWEKTLGQSDNADAAGFSPTCHCQLFDRGNVKYNPANSYKGPLPAPNRSQMKLEGYPTACDRCFATLMKAHDQDILYLSERVWDWNVYGDRDCQHSSSIGGMCDCNDCARKRLFTDPLHFAVERKMTEAQILRPDLRDPSGLEGISDKLEQLTAIITGLSISKAEVSESQTPQLDGTSDVDIDEGL
ncbi:MAG: hypothetical protein M1835_001542 [Candelina submexicana]|nr:MAG: hypothetical protein M1835_001542 [Candelina submexicana]